MNPNNKKYGLLMPKKKQGELKSTNVFGDDSDDEDPRAAVNTSIQKSALLSKIKRQTQLEIDNALQDDPTVYEYDSIYDNIQAEKTQKEIDIKQKKDKKPKYITGLLKAAETRKREDERRTERKVQKEREKEGNEFEDKDVFVTGAYRKKMQEMQELEEKERREAELEALCDVKKQKDMSGFYRYLLKEKTGESVAADTGDSLPQVKTEPTDDKPQRNHRRQRHDSSSSSSSSSSSKSSSEERKTHKSSQSHNRERSSEKHNSSRQEKTRSFEMSRSSEDGKDRDRHGDRDRQHRDYKSDSSRHRHSESDSGRHRHSESDSSRHRYSESDYLRHRQGDTDSYKQRERYNDSHNRKHENDKERHRNDKGKREEGHSRNSSSGHRSEKYERRRDDDERRNSKERDQRLKEDRDRKRDRSVSEDGRSEPKSTGKTDDISGTKNKETEDSKIVGPAKPKEKKSEKYAKRNTDNSVNDARARYLARKLGKERARPVVQNDNDD